MPFYPAFQTPSPFHPAFQNRHPFTLPFPHLQSQGFLPRRITRESLRRLARLPHALARCFPIATITRTLGSSFAGSRACESGGPGSSAAASNTRARARTTIAHQTRDLFRLAATTTNDSTCRSISTRHHRARRPLTSLTIPRYRHTCRTLTSLTVALAEKVFCSKHNIFHAASLTSGRSTMSVQEHVDYQPANAEDLRSKNGKRLEPTEFFYFEDRDDMGGWEDYAAMAAALQGPDTESIWAGLGEAGDEEEYMAVGELRGTDRTVWARLDGSQGNGFKTWSNGAAAIILVAGPVAFLDPIALASERGFRSIGGLEGFHHTVLVHDWSLVNFDEGPRSLTAQYKRIFDELKRRFDWVEGTPW